jgi:hypothetical protein
MRKDEAITNFSLWAWARGYLFGQREVARFRMFLGERVDGYPPNV